MEGSQRRLAQANTGELGNGTESRRRFLSASTAVLAGATAVALVRPGSADAATLKQPVYSGSAGVPAWTASTAYVVNQMVSYGSQTFICATAHTSGASFPGPGSTWQVIGAADLVANVLTYGADPTGTTDSTTAFQNAINAVSPTSYNGPSGTVFAPGGSYLIKSLTLGQRVHLMGAGIGSTQLVTNSSAANAVMITNSQNVLGSNKPANMCEVSGMALFGAQTSGTWQSGIVFNNTNAGYEYQDARHQIHNVDVGFFTGDGIVQCGFGVDQISSCQVFACGGFGFIIGEDSEVTGCDAGGNGIDGFYSTVNSAFAGCKAWYNGSALTSTRGSSGATALTVNSPGLAWSPPGPYTLANGYGNGFWGGGNAGGTFAGCEAQDNSRSGFYGNYRAIFTGCVADSNNNCGLVSGTTSLGKYAGFDLNGDQWEVTGCLSWDRDANSSHQTAAVNLGYESKGRIRMQFQGELSDGSNMPPFTAGSFSSLQFVDAKFNSSGDSYGILSSAISGSMTFDPFQATANDILLGGNLTVAIQYVAGDDNNNPAKSTTGVFLYPGLKISFMVRQGSTGGYRITWPSNTKLGGSIPTTANSVTYIELVYDGTNWRQTTLVAMSS